MFKSKYTIVAILIFMIFSISNIFSIVYIEYNAVSLVEYRKYSVECGPLSVSYTHLTLPTTPYV